MNRRSFIKSLIVTAGCMALPISLLSYKTNHVSELPNIGFRAVNTEGDSLSLAKLDELIDMVETPKYIYMNDMQCQKLFAINKIFRQNNA